MAVRFQGNLAILPRDEYDALKALANEALEDQAMARLVDREILKVKEGMPVFPIAIANRVANGENPVRVFRQWRNMTQAELAGGVDIPQGYLSDIETGKRKGPLDLHRRLAKALGVPLDLLAGDGIADPQPIKARSLTSAKPKRSPTRK